MSAPAVMAEERRLLPSGALSLFVHAVFVGLLVYTVQWQNHPSAPYQAEVWSSLPPLPQQVAVPAAPAVQPPPPPPPPVARPAPVEAPPVVKPAIVTEKAAVKPVPPRKEPDTTDDDRQKLAREEAALRKLDRDARAQEARAKADQVRQEQAEEQRLAGLQQAADARAKADQAAAQASLLDGVKNRIIAKIKSNTVVPASVPPGIELTVKFVVLPDGSVLDGSVHVVSSSGNPTYDDAVVRAVIASQPLPMPDDVLMRRALRDIRLKVNNIH